MRIVVTGANGFVGSHLCEALRRYGHDVVACVRQHPDAHQYAIGDMAEDDKWDDILPLADSVIHLAGRVHQTSEALARDDVAFDKDNVQATQLLLEACQRSGVRRFIFVSTIAVLGYASHGSALKITDTAPYNAYSRSKLRAETLVQDSALDWSIVRIPLTYGAGVKANFQSLINAIIRGVPMPVGCATNRRNILYVGNLTHALHHILNTPAAHRRVLHIADAHPLSTRVLMESIGRALQRPARIYNIPCLFMRFAAMCLGKQMLYAKLFGDFEMETQSTNDLLGWHPPYSTDDGLREMAASFTKKI